MTQEQVAVTAEKIRAGKTSLGIEFGSTRIKAVLIDDAYHTIAAGDYEWGQPSRGRAVELHPGGNLEGFADRIRPGWPATSKPPTANG